MRRSAIALAVLSILTVLMVADASATGMRILTDFLGGFGSFPIPDRRAVGHRREGVLTAAPGLAVLEVTGAATPIEIVTADQIRVSYRIRLLAADRATAEAHAAAITVELTREGQRGRLSVTEPAVRPYGVSHVEVDLLIEAPSDLPVEAGGRVLPREDEGC